jgi:hypothetical protein
MQALGLRCVAEGPLRGHPDFWKAQKAASASRKLEKGSGHSQALVLQMLVPDLSPCLWDGLLTTALTTALSSSCPFWELTAPAQGLESAGPRWLCFWKQSKQYLLLARDFSSTQVILRAHWPVVTSMALEPV